MIITLATPYMNATVWDLDGYLVNLRGPALRDAAQTLDLDVRGCHVAVVRQAIRTHLITQRITPLGTVA